MLDTATICIRSIHTMKEVVTKFYNKHVQNRIVEIMPILQR